MARAHANPARSPGNGADRPDETHRLGQYVYVARSRRSGGLSLGIDLTPSGHCSFNCVYCQASHPPTRNLDLSVDITRMRDDLQARLQEDRRGELKDLVLAGSGEPTSVPNLRQVLEAIQKVWSNLHLDIPVRVFSNGRHLDDPDVGRALATWCRRGGELWIKLDGGQNDTVALINGRRFDVAAHLRSVWAFAKEHEIGLQTMLLRGPGLPSPEAVVNEVIGVLSAAIEQGAKLRELHLLTLSRPPAEETAARVLVELSANELDAFAERIRNGTGLRVRVFPALGTAQR